MNKEDSKKEFIKKIKEMWATKRGKAIIKLCLYLIFFIGVIIFVRISNSVNTSNNNTNTTSTFLSSISDNYEFNIDINLNDNIYNYTGTVLGNNSNITKSDTKEYNYKFMNNNYYLLDDNGNYIITTKEDVYSYIEYTYLDINYIKKLISLGTKKDNIYIIELNKLILNSTSEEYITINIDEENKSIIIDYTNLLKVSDNTINKLNVTLKYSKINEILTLE